MIVVERLGGEFAVTADERVIPTGGHFAHGHFQPLGMSNQYGARLGAFKGSDNALFFQLIHNPPRAGISHAQPPLEQ